MLVRCSCQVGNFNMCISHRNLTLMISVVFVWVINGNVANIKQDVAEETQHAICNITTKDVQTSANASVTRQLRGVCTSGQLELRFKELEVKLMKELHSIKKMFGQQDLKRSLDEPYPKANSLEHLDNMDSTRSFDDIDVIEEETLPIFTSFKTTRIQTDNEYDQEPVFIPGVPKSKSDSPLGFSLEKIRQKQASINDLDRISHLNDTMQKEGNSNVYYYFWKVENFNELMSRSDMYKSSPSFLVLGHELDIQIFPNQPMEDCLTMKLRVSRSFVKNHKFSILKRTPTGKNINSSILRMNPKGSEKFPVTLRSIKNSECLENDSIIVELNIYL